LAEPPALSPSTRNSSDLAGSRSEQSWSLPGSGGVDDLLDDRACVGRIFLEPFGELVGHQAFERLADFGGDELVLGLRAEFRVRQLDRHDRSQALAHVFAGQIDLLALQDARLVGVIVERAG